MKKKSLFILSIIIIGLFLIPYFSKFKNSNTNFDYTLDGLSIKGTSIQGGQVDMSGDNKSIYIIDFWATWCPPCVAEIPHFIKLQQKYSDKNLQIIGISIDDTRDVLPNFISKHKINYPIIFGGKDLIKAYGDIKSIPTTFILDSKLNIIKKVEGYRSIEFFESILSNHI